MSVLKNERFDIEEVIRILGLEIRAEQADEGRDFDVACRIALNKLEKCKKYEELEEQGLLLRLPCRIEQDIYYVPSKVTFDLNILNNHKENNKAYHQNVAQVTYTRHGWHLECDKDMEYGTGGIFLDKMFGETWFLTEGEAEEKLRELEGK